jgi:hypothetical protein
MVFGEMNAGTVACASTPAILRTLPDNAYLRTASYVDDHAQGSHTFADLLKGYADFLAVCEKENWTLNATKTMVGFPACNFFGFRVKKQAPASPTQILTPSDAWSHPPMYLNSARRSEYSFNHPGSFPTTRTSFGRSPNSPAASTASPFPSPGHRKGNKALITCETSFWMAFTLPPDYRLPVHSGAMHPMMEKPMASSNLMTYQSTHNSQLKTTARNITTVRLTDSDTLHTIPHSTETRHNIAWFSKVWSDADRKRAPFYLEADTLL